LEFGLISKSLDLELLRAPLLRPSEMQERAAHRPGPCKAALNVAVAEEWALAAPRRLRGRNEPLEGLLRASGARWAGPGFIKISDSFSDEWHEWPAAECLPGVVAEADRPRKSK
jgi:hypothetical protein